MAPLTIESDIEQLQCAARTIQAVVRHAAPGSVSGDEARLVVDLLAEVERAAASGIALFSPRVVETGAHAKAGHGTPAQWLASVSGSSASVAQGRLASARAARADEGLTEALHQSELSSAELKLMSAAETAAPGSAGRLLGLAAEGASHQELNDAAARLLAAARSQEKEAARRVRVHEHRHFRWHQNPEGGIGGEFTCDEVAWARVGPGLEAKAKERWKAAGSKEGSSLDAHRLDAFLELLAGSSSDPGSPPRARVETLVLINAESFRRGCTEGDEICEIEGIGPVSVAAATELLCEGGLRYLVKEGFDIKTVTKSTRDIARCIDAALIARDRTCGAQPCGQRLGLERDHVRIDYKDEGPTELDNLVRLCPPHHALKTFGGWSIQGEPGHWKWVAPAHPKSAGAISRARKVATAKGKAGVTKDRNRPMRD